MTTEAKTAYVNSADRAFVERIVGVFDEEFMQNAAKGIECTPDEATHILFYAFAFNEF